MSPSPDKVAKCPQAFRFSLLFAAREPLLQALNVIESATASFGAAAHSTRHVSMQRAASTKCKDNYLASIISEGGDTAHRQETWHDLQKAQDLMAVYTVTVMQYTVSWNAFRQCASTAS